MVYVKIPSEQSFPGENNRNGILTKVHGDVMFSIVSMASKGPMVSREPMVCMVPIGSRNSMTAAFRNQLEKVLPPDPHGLKFEFFLKSEGETTGLGLSNHSEDLAWRSHYANCTHEGTMANAPPQLVICI